MSNYVSLPIPNYCSSGLSICFPVNLVSCVTRALTLTMFISASLVPKALMKASLGQENLKIHLKNKVLNTFTKCTISRVQITVRVDRHAEFDVRQADCILFQG